MHLVIMLLNLVHKKSCLSRHWDIKYVVVALTYHLNGPRHI